jgi:RHS repeat-associated protein
MREASERSGRRWRRLRRTLTSVGVLFALAQSANAFAREDSGVAPTRLVLPKGPGSLGGIGENAQPTLSMGLLTYGVGIEVPQGYAGLTPELRLSYSSGYGNSLVGIGWDLGTPSIERMTATGAPLYGKDDKFAANGSDELVKVSTATPGRTVYRARIESGFIRYTWIDLTPAGTAGTGANGYWTAEYPDGSVGYFGARADGTLVDTAVVKGGKGTFRYHLTERVDPLGRRILYTYRKEAARVQPARIAYVWNGATPRYEVVFDYEDRPDVLSDARAGFNLKTSKRLSMVTVLARGQQLRRYALAYEPASLSGGLSRLQTLTTFGRGNEVAPVKFGFEYSGSLPDGCSSGSTCGAFVAQMPEALGVDPRDGSVDLVDLDGDALPDVLSTHGGVHTFWFNRPEVNGAPHLAAPVVSQLGHGDLAGSQAQLLDVNGDGFTDFLDAQTGSVLFNRGSGDWIVNDQFHPSGLPNLDSPNLRYLDYNDDKQVDLVQSDVAGGTRYWENRGNGQFLAVTAGATPLGVGFDDGVATLADMNGDGLQDVVRVNGGNVEYRLDMGLGAFTGWQPMGAIQENYRGEARFVDMNGDGLADAVIVRAGQVLISLNRNGASFDAPRVWTSSAALPFPSTTDGVVRYADMNGSGSTDIVWIDASGRITYLDLFAQRPNLMRRMYNGIGKVIEAQYGSSTGHLLRDGRTRLPTYRLPNVIATVDRLLTYDTLSGQASAQSFAYHDGFYDGKEKQFRGFTRVDVSTTSGQGVEAGSTAWTFDVGFQTVAKKGLVTEQAEKSGDRDLDVTSTSYIDCQVNGSAPGVRFVCPQHVVHTIKEGRPAAEWVRTEETYTYDGYGNRILEVKTGDVAVTGDEETDETTYVLPGNTVSPAHPNGLWMLNKPSRKRVSFRADGTGGTVEVYHYDGADFVGLPERSATNGLLTRVESLADASGAMVDVQRNRYDANGAFVETRDANGHRRSFTYDENGLQTTSETALLDGPGHAPYGLTMSLVYDPVQDLVVEAHPWVRTDAAPGDTRRTLYAWDGLGRLTAIAKPGDSLAAPTEEFSYELADPVSRIVHRSRSVAGAATADLEDVQCFDGMGRSLQSRNRIASGLYQVSGFNSLSGVDKPYREAMPYLSTSGICDRTPPADGRARSIAYDARGRALDVTKPDASIYGSPSHVRSSFAPLTTTSTDEEGSLVGGLHDGAARIRRTDGLGRVVTIERHASGAEPSAIPRFGYDDYGRLSSRTDPAGHVTRRVKDALGRTLRLEDPDAGTTTYENDALGQPVRRVDARGVAVRLVYDEVNRVVERYEENDRAGTLTSYSYDTDVCIGDVCGTNEGELASASFPLLDGSRGSERETRDARGRIVRVERMLDGKAYVVGTEYDNVGRGVARLYPGGRRVEQTLDGIGRVTAIPGVVDAIRYDRGGAMAQITRRPGFTTSYGYDALDRLSTLGTVSPAGTLQAYSYTHDRAGNLTHVDDTTPVGDDEPSLTADYAFDSLYRLTSARLDPDRSREETIAMAYDASDNIVSKTSSLGSASPEHIGDYVYAGTGPHAVTAAGDLALGYDAAGNLTSRGELAFDWDGYGRMADVRRGPETLARFAYDMRNQRVEKLEDGHVTYYVTEDYEVRDGAEVIYVHAGNRPVAKIEARKQTEPGTVDLGGDGLVDAADAWLVLAARAGIVTPGADLTRMLAMSARGLLLGDAATDVLTYQLTDQLGSVVATTDAAGTLLQRTTVYPFGGERSNLPDYREDRVFTDKELDRSSGLTYFGARYLDGRLGRWASADPAFLPNLEMCRDHVDECNLYQYAANDPVGKIDPTGTTVEDLKKVGDSKFMDHMSLGSDMFTSGSKAVEIGLHAIDNAKGFKMAQQFTSLQKGALSLTKLPGVFFQSPAARAVSGFADKVGIAVAPAMVIYGGYSMYNATQGWKGGWFANDKKVQDFVAGTSTTLGGVAGFAPAFAGTAAGSAMTTAAPLVASFGVGFYAGRKLDEHYKWSDRMSAWVFNKFNPNWREGRMGR